MQTHDINGEMAAYTAADQQKQGITHIQPGLSGFKSSLINIGLTVGELLLLIGGDDLTNLGMVKQRTQDLTHPMLPSSLD